MNSKIQKLELEIEKTHQRIETLKTKLSDLNHQKDTLEKIEIVEMVRSVQATPEELVAFIKAFKENAALNHPFQPKEATHESSL